MIDRIRAAMQDGRDLDARFLMAAYISSLATPRGLRPVLVGGSAIDFYTAGALGGMESSLPMRLRASMDLDFLALDAGSRVDNQSLRRLLAEHGFEPARGVPVEACRSFTHPEVPVAIDVVGTGLYGSPDLLVPIEVEEHTVWLWGREDTYWHYLEAAHATRHRHDYTRAQAMLAVHGEVMDWEYIEGLARAAGLESALAASRAWSGAEDFFAA